MGERKVKAAIALKYRVGRGAGGALLPCRPGVAIEAEKLLDAVTK